MTDFLPLTLAFLKLACAIALLGVSLTWVLAGLNAWYER